MMTSSIHTVIPKEWSEEERQLFFRPELVRWKWPFPGLAQFPRLNSAKEFYLRPELHVDKFPRERKIILSPELTARINAQEHEGRLVFDRLDRKSADFWEKSAEKKEASATSSVGDMEKKEEATRE